MNNPFKMMKTDSNDRKKQQLEKDIKASAWNITKKVAIGRCTKEMIDELEDYYKEYFKLYPNTSGQDNSLRRISQLRQIIK